MSGWLLFLRLNGSVERTLEAILDFFLVCCLHRGGGGHKHSRVQNVLRKRYTICVRFLQYHTLCQLLGSETLLQPWGQTLELPSWLAQARLIKEDMLGWWRWAPNPIHSSSHLLGAVILSLEVPLWDSCSLPPPNVLCQSQGFHWFVTPFHSPEPETFCAYWKSRRVWTDSRGRYEVQTDVLQAFIMHRTVKLVWRNSSFWAQLTSICTLYPRKHLPYTVV